MNFDHSSSRTKFWYLKDFTKKSIVFNLVFQDNSKTLEDKDVNPIIDEIINVVKAKFNAKLRA